MVSIVHPDDRKIVRHRLSERMNGNNIDPQNYRFRIMTGGGETRWVDIYDRSIIYRGKPANFLTMADISELKEAEQALRV
ncbi:MAG: PAS domain S-box protein, partial [Spirochaetia bacterium]|nr:PAS domain S-box protein [Spirochaetia bacterium]